MPTFLRTPKHGEVPEGETFTDVRNGEVIAQVCHEGKCLEVRKSLKNKDGGSVSSAERVKRINAAKKEVLAKTVKTPAKPKKAAKKAAPKKKAAKK